MATSDNNPVPYRATHPGEIIRLELEERSIRQKDFADLIGVPASNFNAFLRGKRSLNSGLALKISKELGITYDSLMALQSGYERDCICIAAREEKETKALKVEKSLNERFNLKFLYKFFGIDRVFAYLNIEELHKALSLDLNSVMEAECITKGYFRRSDKLQIDERNLRTWLLLADLIARKATSRVTYKEGEAVKAAEQIASLSRKGKLTKKGIRDILDGHGIYFTHIPKLDKTPVDAYSTKVGVTPTIIATFRHNDMDKLAFDILHELAHIHLHLSKASAFINIHGVRQTEIEAEADAFARDMLISPTEWREIISCSVRNISVKAIMHTIASEAKKRGIAPSIAVSRYKHDSASYAFRGYRSPKII